MHLTKEQDGWLSCSKHKRILTYPEWVSKHCWWCNPEYASDTSPIKKLSSDELALLKEGNYSYSSKKTEEAHVIGKTKAKKKK